MEIEKQLLKFRESYPEKYRESNMLLAYIAAFPGVFNSHLLYQLWLNFGTYEKDGQQLHIYPIAVSDLIQSNLCQSIGSQLHEMDEEAQKYFEEFPSTFLPNIDIIFSRKDLASFTLLYANKYFSSPNQSNIRDVLYWKSLVILDPNIASQKIANTLSQTSKNENLSIRDVQLLLQVMDLESSLNEGKNYETSFSKYPIVSNEIEGENVFYRKINHPAIYSRYQQLDRPDKKVLSSEELRKRILALGRDYKYDETFEVLSLIQKFFQKREDKYFLEKLEEMGYVAQNITSSPLLAKYHDDWIYFDNFLDEVLSYLRDYGVKQLINQVEEFFGLSSDSYTYYDASKVDDALILINYHFDNKPPLELEQLINKAQSIAWAINPLKATDPQIEENQIELHYLFQEIFSLILVKNSKSWFRKLDELVGLDEAKLKIKGHFDLLKANQNKNSNGINWIFKGNPGTGKSKVAKILTDIYHREGLLKKGQLVSETEVFLIRPFEAGSATKIKRICNSALHGTLLIKDADLLEKGESTSLIEIAILSLLKFMEDHRNEICVILSGTSKGIENLLTSYPKLRPHFQTKIEFDDYSIEELWTIFQSFSEGYSITRRAEDKIKKYLSKAIELSSTNTPQNAHIVLELFSKVEESISSKSRRKKSQKSPELFE